MSVRAGLMVICLGTAVQAQEATPPEVAKIMQALPAKMLKRLNSAPDAFVQDAAGLIYGFGRDGGIDAAGIDAFIAAERARVRAGVMTRYLAADLDNDGAVARAEMAGLANAAAAGKRGSLLLGFDQADSDQNDALSDDELRKYAQGEAMKKLSDTEAEAMRGLLVFDLDGDGVVTMTEVASGVTALLNDA